MKNTIIAVAIAAAVAVGIIAGIYVANYNKSPTGNNNANATGQDTNPLDLKLLSTSLLDTSRSAKGPITDNQVFKVREPVVIQTNFSNPYPDSHEYIVVSEIRGSSATSAMSNVDTTIGGSANLSTELYWRPEVIGDYELLVFQIPIEAYNSGPPVSPLVHFSLKVTE
jgi:hypothetical protein